MSKILSALSVILASSLFCNSIAHSAEEACDSKLLRSESTVQFEQKFLDGQSNVLLVPSLPLFTTEEAHEVEQLLQNAYKGIDKEKFKGIVDVVLERGAKNYDFSEQAKKILSPKYYDRLINYVNELTAYVNATMASESGPLKLGVAMIRLTGTEHYMHVHSENSAYITILKTERGAGTIYNDDKGRLQIVPNNHLAIMTDYQRARALSNVNIVPPEHGPSAGRRILLLITFSLL